MKENLFVIYFFSSDDFVNFVGFTDNEDYAKKLIEIKKIETGMEYYYGKARKILFRDLNERKLGYKVTFSIGKDADEYYKMSPKSIIQYAYDINKDFEKAIYVFQNQCIDIYIQDDDEYRARQRAIFYYRELVKDILINEYESNKAVMRLNEKILNRNNKEKIMGCE